jgi:sugar-specific transcriptional regulator TrmB
MDEGIRWNRAQGPQDGLRLVPLTALGLRDKNSSRPDVFSTHGPIEESRSDPAQVSESDVKNLVVELTKYGLTINQARLYIHLLGRKESSVSEIASSSGIHRVDVYRKLKEMEILGLVERHLDTPTKYTARTPREAIGELVSRQELNASKLRTSSKRLSSRLEALEDASSIRILPSKLSPDYRFRSAVGRDHWNAEYKELASLAKHEIMSLTSANGIKRAILIGNVQDFKKAVDRKIRVRLIGDIIESNLDQAERLAQTVEVRHAPNIHFRLHIFDHTTTIFSARFDDQVTNASSHDDYFVFKDEAISSAFSFIFDNFWKSCVPLEERASQLRSIHKSQTDV